MLLKMQNMWHIYYSVNYIFEYYPNIFWILFVYVESAKHVLYHYTIFLNIIRIFSEYYSYMLKVQNNVIFIIQHFWILSVYFRNLIRIDWKCKIGIIFIIQLYIFEYYPYIFGILFVYVENAKHASYSLFNIF